MLSKTLLAVGLIGTAWLLGGLVTIMFTELSVNLPKLVLWASIPALCFVGSIAARRLRR
ncbi:MAG: hypothetical protein HYW91_02135 [Candidatus Sungbacteria bacterium]|nr:hypothetical protein [Candidatus Sungbacteria bacterium]